MKEAKEIPVLTPGAGERAMLIKSTRDSGICVGVWEGLREAKAQTKTDPVLPSTPGTSSSGPDLITVRDLTFF